MTNIIQDLVVKLGFATDVKSLKNTSNELDKVSDSIQDLSVESNNSETALKNLDFNLSNVKDTLLSLNTKVMTTVGAFVGILGVSAKFTDELGHTAKRAGMTAQDLNSLGYAVGQTGGSADAAISTLSGLGSAIYDAQFSSNGLSEGLGELGLTLYNSNGQLKDAKELIYEVSDAIQGMDRSRQMSLISQMGLNGVGDLLLEGSKAIKMYQAESDRMNYVTAESVKIAQDFNDSLGKFWSMIKGLTRTVADSFLPIFTKMIKSFTNFYDQNKELIDQKLDYFLEVVTNNIKFLGIALGGIMGLGFLAFIGTAISAIKTLGVALFASGLKALPLMLALAGVYLVLEDIYTFLNDGDSLIGRFFNKIASAIKTDFGATLYASLHFALKPFIDLYNLILEIPALLDKVSNFSVSGFISDATSNAFDSLKGFVGLGSTNSTSTTDNSKSININKIEVKTDNVNDFKEQLFYISEDSTVGVAN